MKFSTVRPLLQVITRWPELCQVGSAKVSKSSDWLNTFNKEDQNKRLHLNTAYYIAEKHSNSLPPTRGRRSSNHIAPIRFRINRHLLETRCFSNLYYQRSFQKKKKSKKSEERLKNEKGQTKENLNLKTAQVLTTSQQNPLTEKTSCLSSISYALKGIQSKNGQYVNLTKIGITKKIGLNDIDSFWA
jgi:hypothetical protein